MHGSSHLLKRPCSASSHGNFRTVPQASAASCIFRQGCFISGSPRGPRWSPPQSTETSGCLSGQGLCPPVTGYQAPLADPFSSPREALLWPIPFGLTGPRGGVVGAAWQGPPISHIRSILQTGPGGSSSPAPGQAAPVPPLCAGIGRLSPVDLPASGDMWKVKRQKWFLQREGERSCTERKEIPLWDFFPPSSSSKKYRDSLSLMRMPALNLLGLD